MPRYPHLLTSPFDTSLIGSKLRALRTVGVPYSDGEIESAETSMRNQANVIAKEVESQQGPTGLADKEIIALTAYLQRLGTDIRWKRPEAQAPYSATALPPQAPVAAPAAPAAQTPPATPSASAAPAGPAVKTQARATTADAPEAAAPRGGTR